MAIGWTFCNEEEITSLGVPGRCKTGVMEWKKGKAGKTQQTDNGFRQ